MKSYIFLLTALFLITSCSNTGKSKQNPALTPVKGYFVKNTVEDTGNLQCYVFKDQSAMMQICGMAATMQSKPDVPDFNKVLVVAIAGKNTSWPTTIDIVGANIEKGTLIISVAEEISDEEQTYTMRPLTLAAVDKAGIKKVVFRKGGIDIFTAE